MYFGQIAAAEGEGAIVAHSLRGAGFSFKKGRVLSSADVAQLLAAGVGTVIGARLGADDVHEDEAAAALAGALAGRGCVVSAPFTGRCNLFAAHDGLLALEVARIDAMNAVDESITVATLERSRRVWQRQMLATVKIIPFAVPRASLDAALDALAPTAAHEGPPAVSVAGFGGAAPRRVVLVQTQVANTRDSVLDKTTRVVEGRLASLGGTLVAERRTPHDELAVAAALRDLSGERPDWVMMVGASAIVDRRDVLPASVTAAGGTVTDFGMPVDPGNLLMMGTLDGAIVIGMPGCARSPKRNGLDLVLERLSAGLPVTRREVAAMGVGGLLKDSAARQASRVAPARADTIEQGGEGGDRAMPESIHGTGRAPRVAALLLAAGQSRRMGPRNKLLIEVAGRTMVGHAADAVRRSTIEWLVVVTGHEPDAVRRELDGAGVHAFVHNERYAQGLSTSLSTGLDALPAEAEAVLVVLGDMPGVQHTHLDRLVAGFDPVEGREICVPTFDGKRGNPVLFSRRFFAEMRTVSGDLGARHLLSDYEDCVAEVPMPDRAVLTDIDNPQMLAALDSSPV